MRPRLILSNWAGDADGPGAGGGSTTWGDSVGPGGAGGGWAHSGADGFGDGRGGFGYAPEGSGGFPASNSYGDGYSNAVEGDPLCALD